MQLQIAHFTLQLQFDCETCCGGTIVRDPDGVEARFNSPECLIHLLEGLIGGRIWCVYKSNIEAQIAPLLHACA